MVKKDLKIEEAKKQLDALIAEIEKVGGFLNIFAIEDLKRIRKLLE